MFVVIDATLKLPRYDVDMIGFGAVQADLGEPYRQAESIEGEVHIALISASIIVEQICGGVVGLWG